LFYVKLKKILDINRRIVYNIVMLLQANGKRGKND